MNEPTYEEKSDAYHAGYRGYKSEVNNPYAANHPLHGYWDTGWRKAQYDKVVGDIRAVTIPPRRRRETAAHWPKGTKTHNRPPWKE